MSKHKHNWQPYIYKENGMSGGTATSTGMPTQPYERKITYKDVIEAVANEINQLRNELSSVSLKVRKYERIFEQAFKQEAEERLGLSKDKLCDQCSAIGALEHLKWRMNKQG